MKELEVVGEYHKAYEVEAWITYKLCKTCSNPVHRLGDLASQTHIGQEQGFCSVLSGLKGCGHGNDGEHGVGDRKNRERKSDRQEAKGL